MVLALFACLFFLVCSCLHLSNRLIFRLHHLTKSKIFCIKSYSPVKIWLFEHHHVLALLSSSRWLCNGINLTNILAISGRQLSLEVLNHFLVFDILILFDSRRFQWFDFFFWVFKSTQNLRELNLCGRNFIFSNFGSQVCRVPCWAKFDAQGLIRVYLI